MSATSPSTYAMLAPFQQAVVDRVVGRVIRLAEPSADDQLSAEGRCIGVVGDRGTGKSAIMAAVREQLERAHGLAAPPKTAPIVLSDVIDMLAAQASVPVTMAVVEQLAATLAGCPDSPLYRQACDRCDEALSHVHRALAHSGRANGEVVARLAVSLEQYASLTRRATESARTLPAALQRWLDLALPRGATAVVFLDDLDLAPHEVVQAAVRSMLAELRTERLIFVVAVDARNLERSHADSEDMDRRRLSRKILQKVLPEGNRFDVPLFTDPSERAQFRPRGAHSKTLEQVLASWVGAAAPDSLSGVIPVQPRALIALIEALQRHAEIPSAGEQPRGRQSSRNARSAKGFAQSGAGRSSRRATLASALAAARGDDSLAREIRGGAYPLSTAVDWAPLATEERWRQLVTEVRFERARLLALGLLNIEWAMDLSEASRAAWIEAALSDVDVEVEVGGLGPAVERALDGLPSRFNLRGSDATLARIEADQAATAAWARLVEQGDRRAASVLTFVETPERDSGAAQLWTTGYGVVITALHGGSAHRQRVFLASMGVRLVDASATATALTGLPRQFRARVLIADELQRVRMNEIESMLVERTPVVLALLGLDRIAVAMARAAGISAAPCLVEGAEPAVVKEVSAHIRGLLHQALKDSAERKERLKDRKFDIPDARGACLGALIELLETKAARDLLGETDGEKRASAKGSRRKKAAEGDGAK